MLLIQLRNVLTQPYFTAKLEDGSTTTGQMGLNNYLNSFFGGSPYNYNYINGSSMSTGIHWALPIGTGDTEPTFEDYCLANKTSPTDMTWITSSTSRASGSMVWLVSSTYRNDSAAPITIKEIGLTLYLNNAGNNKGVLIARSILETPVTIGVGESYTFTYSIEL